MEEVIRPIVTIFPTVARMESSHSSSLGVLGGPACAPDANSSSPGRHPRQCRLLFGRSLLSVQVYGDLFELRDPGHGGGGFYTGCDRKTLALVHGGRAVVYNISFVLCLSAFISIKV